MTEWTALKLVTNYLILSSKTLVYTKQICCPNILNLQIGKQIIRECSIVYLKEHLTLQKSVIVSALRIGYLTKQADIKSILHHLYKSIRGAEHILNKWLTEQLMLFLLF